MVLSHSFEAQLQQWLSPTVTDFSDEPSANKKTVKSRQSAELEQSWLSRGKERDETEVSEVYYSSDSSVRRGLQQLRKKIRLAKYMDVQDNILLHNLMNTTPPHVPTPQT